MVDLQTESERKETLTVEEWCGGGGCRGAVGLLGPIEAIVICNIHSNVPYQMQQVWRCSEREISLVPHSALVTPRANSDKWIYLDNAYGTVEEDVQKAERAGRQRGARLTTHLICPFSLPLCLWLDLNKRCWSLFKHSCSDNRPFFYLFMQDIHRERAQIHRLHVVERQVESVKPSSKTVLIRN